VLLETVEIFDVDWLAGMSFGLFPLQYGDANELIEDLNTIFAASGGEQAGQGMLRFMPITNLNAVLVISHQAAYIERARTWIERLDQTGNGTARRIYVYRVQNARSEHLAQVLTQIFTGQDPADGPVASLAPGLDPVHLASPPAASEAAAEGAEGTAQPPTSAATPAAASTGEGITFTGQSEFRIIADTERNSLVILATPQEYRMVDASLRKLDTIPLQVLIQATVVEVTLTDDLSYGVRWFLERNNHTLDLNNLPAIAGGGLFYSFTSTDFMATLEALASITDLNIISSPELLVLDNHTATLQVGDQVPVATRTVTSVTDPEAPVVNEIQFRDTGVILRVTPRVNSGGLVTLEIEQEVSDVAPAAEPTVTPTIFRRTIQTTVAVQSGESVALGGLISDTSRHSRSGVPILASIPILGALFSATNIETERTELLVLLTPTVVRDQRDARLVTDEMRRRMGSVENLLRKSQIIVIDSPLEVAPDGAGTNRSRWYFYGGGHGAGVASSEEAPVTAAE
jgi:general secretion pathway protein D